VYTHTNFKTKKALKEAVLSHQLGTGAAVTYYQPGPFGGNEPRDGTIYLEGPHYPKAHTWYAQATVKDGVIVKVK
jgi:hypothetical protein